MEQISNNVIASDEVARQSQPKEFVLLDSLKYKYAYSGDRLMAYGNELCAYDGMGNPKVYRDKACSWEKGRQLVSYDGNTFAYDGQGRRITKNGISYTYDSNGNLLKQTDGANTLEFIYDDSGVAGVKYDSKTYVYRKNAQGDIIAILDSAGAVVVKYVYDAWGNHDVHLLKQVYASEQSTHIGYLNPFRYRGYYYDTETKLYYLKTRYYDPVVGRFITIDDLSYIDPEHINGLNLYAYCGNNPVMNVDPEGTSIQDFLTILERIFSGFSGIYKSFAKIAKSLNKIPKGIAKRAFRRLQNQAIAESKQMSKTLGKVATVLAVTTLAIDIGASWYKNYKSGSEHWVTDSIVDTGYIGARFAIGYGITTLCSLIPIPVLGTVFGIGLSIAVDYLITWLVDKTGFLDTVKQWVSQVGTAIKNGWNQFKNWWNGLWS
jgi:RHS repeat-associated protein